MYMNYAQYIPIIDYKFRSTALSAQHNNFKDNTLRLQIRSHPIALHQNGSVLHLLLIQAHITSLLSSKV